MAEATNKSGLSVSDIDKEIARLESLRRDAEEAEAQERLRANHGKATETIDRLMADLKLLDEIGYMPPKLQAALTDGKGKFNPGLYIKKPRPVS